MKKQPKEKNYTVSVKNQRMTLMLTKTADGKPCCRYAECEVPLYLLEVVNEETGEKALVKQTRKQTEKYLLGLVSR